jgi:EAL domain-containing protein (putative c-di-GMP-specific phosphodiesterase class I)
MVNALAEPASATPEGTLAEFQEILAARAIKPVFQPIVRLDTGDVVAYEALARGPYGSAFERPDRLFEAARRLRRLAELDWTCRAMAFSTAIGVGLNPSMTLFVNTEPVALSTPCPPDLRPLLKQAESRLRIVSELTERRLTADPAAILAAISRARDNGWGIALDDVGVEPASIALMPLVHPDVIKLDMKLVQERPTPQSARVIAAVRSKAERTGAAILAEGIETEVHRETAVALGANLGQGWYFGKPGSLPRKSGAPETVVRLIDAPPLEPGTTPFEIARASLTPTRTRLADVQARGRGLIDRANDPDAHLVVLASTREPGAFDQHLGGHFERLAPHCAFNAILSVGMAEEPRPGVRGAALEAADPLAEEWNVVVIGTNFTGALLARQVDGDTYEAIATMDYEVVVAAARTMIARVAPEVQRGAGPAWSG